MIRRRRPADLRDIRQPVIIADEAAGERLAIAVAIGREHLMIEGGGPLKLGQPVIVHFRFDDPAAAEFSVWASPVSFAWGKIGFATLQLLHPIPYLPTPGWSPARVDH